MWICIFFFFLPKERKKYLKRWYLFLQARSKWNKVLGHTNTHWIHGVDWWLWKCRIISKVHTWFKHTVQIGQKTKHLLLGLRHLQRHLHLPWTKISASVEPFQLSTPTWGCAQAGAGDPDHATGQAHLLPIPLDILLLEICTNQLQALWNVFGWNKPTLQGNGFTEC